MINDAAYNPMDTHDTASRIYLRRTMMSEQGNGDLLALDVAPYVFNFLLYSVPLNAFAGEIKGREWIPARV